MGAVALNTYSSTFLTISCLDLDLLTSKPHEFISVSRYTKIVNSVKFPQAVYKISCSRTFGSHTWTNGQTTGKRNFSST